SDGPQCIVNLFDLSMPRTREINSQIARPVNPEVMISNIVVQTDVGRTRIEGQRSEKTACTLNVLVKDGKHPWIQDVQQECRHHKRLASRPQFEAFFDCRQMFRGESF